MKGDLDCWSARSPQICRDEEATVPEKAPDRAAANQDCAVYGDRARLFRQLVALLGILSHQ